MDVLTEKIDDILVVTLNRVHARNSMTAEMFTGVYEAFRQAERDGMAALITRAEGKTFCVGADSGDLGGAIDLTVDEIYRGTFEGRQGLPSVGGVLAQEFDMLGFNRWAWEIANIAVPSIALVGGAAAGGGLALALLHQFRFADSNAKFVCAFGRLGLGPELGCSYFLPEVVGRQVALDMLCTNRLVDAGRAKEVGLVDRLVEPGQLMEAGLAYAREIAAMPRQAVRAGVEALIRARATPLRAAMEHEWRRQKTLWGSDEFKAGVRAVLDSLATKKQG